MSWIVAELHSDSSYDRLCPLASPHSCLFVRGITAKYGHIS